MTFRQEKLLNEYIEAYLSALDCPRALTVYLMFSLGEHKQLSELEFNPLDYNDLNSARDSLAATKFLSKAEFLKIGNDLRKNALDKFFESEQLCKETNRRFRLSLFKNRETEPLLVATARKIDRILGSFNAEELIEACNWGPGATTSIPRRRATHPEKFYAEHRITAEAYDFVHPWFHAAYPNWDVQFEISGASKIVTVPKNAKTDRTIAIEPGLNLWFQKGIGTMIRSRLRRVGIDLNQQRHNQEKARIAAKFNHLATVDFSSASDTISKELVFQLFGTSWYTLLWAFRSSFGLLDDKLLTFEKFSSMGNGFTFELESLIFYAMALAVCEQLGLDTREVSVFGDDVIIPSSAFDLYSRFSDDLGFSVNSKKSYWTSYYRESCGSHFWNGVDIKPIFQKESFSGLQAILKAANSLRRLSHRRNSYGCDIRLRKTWKLLADFLGPKCPRVSEGYGDIALIENIDDEHVSASRAPRGFEGFFVRVWAVQAVKRFLDHHGLLLYKLKQIGGSLDPCSIGNETPMPTRTRYAKIRVLVPRWYDLGPWI